MASSDARIGQRIFQIDWEKESKWRAKALCVSKDVDIKLFFPEEGGNYKTASLICMRCPVRVDCAESEIDRTDYTFGMWGGVNADERNTIRKVRRAGLERPFPKDMQHGTKEAFNIHVQCGQVPCDACCRGWLPLRPASVVHSRTGEG